MFKGIIFILASVLFISRLIPKYLTYQETNQVSLFGKLWEGHFGLFMLLAVAALAVILLVMGITNIYWRLTGSSEQEN